MGSIIDDAWNNIVGLEHWLDANLSTSGIIAIPAIIVALLLPIAIFLMERQDKYEFDKSVIIDKVLSVRLLIPAIIITSIVLLYHSSLLSSLVAFVLVVITSFVLVRTYKWTKSYEATTSKVTYRQQRRLDYLSGLKKENDKLEVWTLILSDQELLEKNQQGLVSRYLDAVKSMKDNKGSYPRTNMHLLLIRNLDKINFSNRESYDELLAYALQYFDQYQAQEEYRRSSKVSKTTKKSKEIVRPEYHLQELFERIMYLSLDDSKTHGVLDYLFFEQIKKYTSKSAVSEPIFAKRLLLMYIQFLETNEKSEIDKLWDYIDSWTVTRAKLEGANTQKLSRDLLQAYIDGIVPKTHTDVKIFSRKAATIDTITEKLLPNVNPILWFNIITFYTVGWGSNKDEDSLHAQIRNHIERGRNFGLMTSSGLMGWDGENDNPASRQASVWKSQDDETIYILGIVFPWLRNPIEIQKVIDMTIMMLNEESLVSEERHKERLLGLRGDFQAILDFTNEEIQRNARK